MPFRARRYQTLEEASPDNGEMGSQTKKLSVYEKSREERIKENLERMQKLGIMDLSLKLKSVSSEKRNRRNLAERRSSQRSSLLQSAGPVRRSSRLQNVTPMSYSEVPVKRQNGSLENKEAILQEFGSKPEVYTEEHEKLLGNTERSWTLFVDGCGKDGKRIYDPVKGKTCHQCRQKTLGYRTQCCKCQMVQGQFCGDCLYMRYGEHVLEALENRDWICPVCRGICNCSLCRQAKGWVPTGPLYKKILRMGYKSVAHYLIKSRRAEENVVDNSDSTHQLSVKRSLDFPDLPKESPTVNEDNAGLLKPATDKGVDGGLQREKEDKSSSNPNMQSNDQVPVKRSLHFSDKETLTKSVVVDHEVNRYCGLFKSEPGDKKDDLLELAEHVIQLKDDQTSECNNALEDFSKAASVTASCKFEAYKEENTHSVDRKCTSPDDQKAQGRPNLGKRALATKRSSDSISGRLKQRRRSGNACPDADNIAGRLRPREKAT